MKKAMKTRRGPDMLDKYDFSKGVRGKYAKRYTAGSKVVVFSHPMWRQFFPTLSQ